MKIQYILLSMIVVLGGCQASDSSVVRESESAKSAISSPGKTTGTVTEQESIPLKDRTSQLDTFVLDGSSKDAFKNSLKQFQEVAPQEEYVKLKSAVQYLLVYDLSVRGNPEKLYKKLDGRTAREVIRMRELH